MKLQSGIRVIYAYHEEEDRIEFIEIYYKGDKASEDREMLWKVTDIMGLRKKR